DRSLVPRRSVPWSRLRSVPASPLQATRTDPSLQQVAAAGLPAPDIHRPSKSSVPAAPHSRHIPANSPPIAGTNSSSFQTLLARHAPIARSRAASLPSVSATILHPLPADGPPATVELHVLRPTQTAPHAAAD